MKLIAFYLLSLLSLGFCFTAQSGKVTVNPGDDLNKIINSAGKGDTIFLNAGEYDRISISDLHFSEMQPLFIIGNDTGPVIIKGSGISKGSAMEVTNCSYILIEGLAFTNAMWGSYIRNSQHIIYRNNEIYETGQEGIHVGRSSKYVDVISNHIHNTGKYNPKWGEGIYIGSGSYTGNNFPDNCEYIWIEGNHIHETGRSEGINIKAECFHITVRNNVIHDINPGTESQYNQAAITVEGGENSLKNNYRTSEKRDIWIENNTIENVNNGFSDWSNGIMFFGTGVYILNNNISNCDDRGIFGNSWKDMGHENYVFGNIINKCRIDLQLHPDLKIHQSDSGINPHRPQRWH
jgi:hypothetical protein